MVRCDQRFHGYWIWDSRLGKVAGSDNLRSNRKAESSLPSALILPLIFICQTNITRKYVSPIQWSSL